MHKTFYASGFLYHSPTQQILLQQKNSNTDGELILFSGKSRQGKNPRLIFKKTIEEALDTSIPESSIYPVYDYAHAQLGEHYIFFAEITDIKNKSFMAKNKSGWLQISKVSKLNMSDQTHHDIIIGERVIRSIKDSKSPKVSSRRID